MKPQSKSQYKPEQKQQDAGKDIERSGEAMQGDDRVLSNANAGTSRRVPMAVAGLPPH